MEAFPIRVVSRRTGLSLHVIRAWERRYSVIRPSRSGTNRRLYSSADIDKLNLLQSAIAAGHSIGRIADMPIEELRRIVAVESTTVASSLEPASLESAGNIYVEHSMAAIRSLDAVRLESELSKAGVALGQVGLIRKVIAPLLGRIGELWHDGELRVAHEHLASATIRSMLGSIREPLAGTASSATIIVTTPAGNLHEFGALLAANAASLDGWRVTYLGPNLPAAEIAGAVLDSGAVAVALSVTYPAGDPRISMEFKELRKLVGPKVPIIVGGRASASYSDVLRETDATRIEDLSAFRSELHRVRTS